MGIKQNENFDAYFRKFLKSNKLFKVFLVKQLVYFENQFRIFIFRNKIPDNLKQKLRKISIRIRGWISITLIY